MKQLIDYAYPGIETLHNFSEEIRQNYFSERAILSPLNANVNELNDACLAQYFDQSKTFLSVDKAINESEYQDYSIPTEYLNTINFSDLSRHSITIKIDCPIILLCNLNSTANLCNDIRLIVVVFEERMIEAKILSETHKDKLAFISRITLSTTSSLGLSFTLCRHQYPFRVAFGMSINKSQSQSLNQVDIYLPTSVFTHDQLYVALSRAKDYRNIYVSLSFQTETLQTDNIVYKEVLGKT